MAVLGKEVSLIEKNQEKVYQKKVKLFCHNKLYLAPNLQ